MTPDVVPREQWLAARRALLAQEKALTRERDRVAAARRALPWVRVDTPYVFDTPEGPCRLSDLFFGRRQLIVQHFMLGPGWKQGCVGCSFMADHVDATTPHLAQRDVAFVAVSRAPLPEIERFRRRMGWRFRWVSSHGSDFNADFGVAFPPSQVHGGQVVYNYATQPFETEDLPGISVFCRDDDDTVFHTYSTYGRGVEVMMGTYELLDLVPRGRDEVAGMGDWVRHHDLYEDMPVAKGSCCGS